MQSSAKMGKKVNEDKHVEDEKTLKMTSSSANTDNAQKEEGLRMDTPVSADNEIE